MTSGLELLDLPTRVAAVVRREVPPAAMAEAQANAHRALAVPLRAGRIAAEGPRLTLWRLQQAGSIDYAPGVFVAASFAAEGDVVPFVVQAGRVAHLRHAGPYERLARAWHDLLRGCAEQGIALSGLNLEVYTAADPAPVTDLYAYLAEPDA